MAKPFERSSLTNRLVLYIKEHNKGDHLSYGELSKAVDEKITPRSHHLRYSRFILARDHSQVWIAVKPGIGIERLNDKQIAERLPSWWLGGAKRRLNRGGDESEIVDFNQLTIDEQARFSVNSIQRQAALQTLSKPMWRKLEKVARGTSQDLPSFNVLEWAFSLTPTPKGSPK